MSTVRLGAGSELVLDYENKCFRVVTNQPLMPGMRGLRREVAVFHFYEEWEASGYSKTEFTDDAYTAIVHFWSDIENPSTK